MEPDPPAKVNPAALALIERLSAEIARNQPGLQSTEFGIVAALLIIDIVFGALDKIPPSLAVIAGSFLSVGYQWLRNNRKGARETSILHLVDLIGKSAGVLVLPPAFMVGGAPGTEAPIAEHPQFAAIKERFGGDDAGKFPAVLGEAGCAHVGGLGLLALFAILAALAITFLAGCAGTEVKSRFGKNLFRTQANADSVAYSYSGGGEHITLQIAKLNHSVATLAGGQAFKLGADSVGTTVVSGVLAGGLPWAKATAAGTQIIPQILGTAAPVVLQAKH